ncbi:MAG: transposase, partial [Planctomycetia bacterium]
TNEAENGQSLRLRARHVDGHGPDRRAQKASPWENGYVESFNGRLRDELLDRELFLSLPEARVVLDQWRMDYNHRRPHGGLKWLTPAAFVAGLDDTASGVVSAASRGESPVGAAPLPPTHHADCSPTLS